jgi:hypothetical protein
MKEREKNPLLHHKVREFDTQKKVFEQLTIASTVLSDPQTAFQEIDRVLHAALRFKRPVYIELPRDLVFVPGIPHHKTPVIHERSDVRSLREALAEAEQMINAARQPVSWPMWKCTGSACGPAPQARPQDQHPVAATCSASLSLAIITRSIWASMKARWGAKTCGSMSRAATASSCSARS